MDPTFGFKHPTHPVERVNWFDCIIFCNKLSEKEGRNHVYHPRKDIRFDEATF